MEIYKYIFKRKKTILSLKNANIESANKVIGLKYIPDYITKEFENKLLDNINKSEWIKDLGRDVQHHGWNFLHDDRLEAKPKYKGELPVWGYELVNKFKLDLLTKDEMDQLLVNKYHSNQGLGAHIDEPACFGDTIISLSLMSGRVMVLKNIKTKS